MFFSLLPQSYNLDSGPIFIIKDLSIKSKTINILDKNMAKWVFNP